MWPSLISAMRSATPRPGSSHAASGSTSSCGTSGPSHAVSGLLVGAVMNQEIANFVCQLLGPAGIIEDDTMSPQRAHFQQSVLFAPGVRLAGGTDEIMRNLLAEQVLGLPQEPRADKGMAFQDIPSGAN